jgi:uncharacterized protein Veg
LDVNYHAGKSVNFDKNFGRKFCGKIRKKGRKKEISGYGEQLGNLLRMR